MRSELTIEICDIIEACLGRNVENRQIAAFEQMLCCFNFAAIAIFFYGVSCFRLEESAKIFFMIIKHSGKV